MEMVVFKMLKRGMTVNDATREWVREFNRVPTDMLQKIAGIDDFDSFREITYPCECDRVYVYETDGNEHYGEITNIRNPPEEDDFDAVLYEIELDDGTTIFTLSDNFDVERDDAFPMWGWM